MQKEMKFAAWVVLAVVGGVVAAWLLFSLRPGGGWMRATAGEHQIDVRWGPLESAPVEAAVGAGREVGP